MQFAKKRGRKEIFTSDEELELRNCIGKLGRLGFAITLSDIWEIVTDYVNISEKKMAQKIFHYKNLKGSPEKDWISSFMKRYNVSLKNATKLSKSRHNASKNSFNINHRIGILEETIENLGLK